MDIRKIRRLSDMIRIVKTIKALKNQKDVLKWMIRHKDQFAHMSPQHLDFIREEAEYDEQEWNTILKKLLGRG